MPPKHTAKRPLTAEDLYDFQFVEDPQISPDGKRIAFVKVTIDKLGNKYNRTIWLAALDGSQLRVRQFTFGARADTSPRWSPDGAQLAFVSARSGKPQIYLIGLEGGEARPLTSMPNGASNPQWSPNGKRLAFNSSLNAEERREEAPGKETPTPASALEARHRDEIKEDKEKKKADPRIVTRLPYRTGTEFLDDRFAHIYVLELPAEGETAKPYRLTEGELDFDQIKWSPDGKYLYSTQAREPEFSLWEKHDIIRLDVPNRLPPLAGGRKPFIRLTEPGYEYFQVAPSPNGKWLAVLRGREQGSWGYVPELCLLPAGGGAARSLTAEFDRSIELYYWSADSKYLYFQAGDHGDTGLYRVSVEGGRVEPLVGGRRMVLGFSVSKVGDIAFTACTPERPMDLYAAKAGGKSEKRVTDFNAQILSQLQLAKTEELSYTAPDGRPIQGWLLKPVGFKKGKKYPLAVNMHGGPHVMWSPSMPGMFFEWQLHAARGYAVFYCNPRGSDGYGSEFATLIQNNWGDEVMHDVLKGVDEMVKRGFVDSKRMALTGGSYAGYMTAWIVAHDQRFACAWSQRGVYSLLSFYGTSDIPQMVEHEFDLAFPGDDLEKSWRQSPLAYARNIHTPLAIEHQENDYRCPISEAEQLFAALKRLRREVVFYRYPREGHEMSRSGEPQHRVDRLNRMVEWFDKYCKRTK